MSFAKLNITYLYVGNCASQSVCLVLIVSPVEGGILVMPSSVDTCAGSQLSFQYKQLHSISIVCVFKHQIYSIIAIVFSLHLSSQLCRNHDIAEC